MSGVADIAGRWMYRGIWGAVVSVLRVPDEPPTLPTRPGEAVERFQPSPGYLRYLKFWFWLGLLPMDLAILAGWLALLRAHPGWAAALAAPALALAVLPDVLVYIGLHLRYDTTWFAMTPRSLRIRRGILVLEEMTITFENVQEVTVRQGPVQRHFGISDVVVRTAGAAPRPGPHGERGRPLNEGVITGVADAPRLRDAVMERVRASRSAGLGDERGAHTGAPAPRAVWGPAHLSALREVRDALRRAAAHRAPPTGG